jgi:uncharacterized membrane protein
VPSPGFTGVGSILTINFKAKKEGQANVSMTNCAVLAADGRGTNILEKASGGSYLISKEIAVTEASTTLIVESIPAPEILIYPETYYAGREIFYVEGTAIPDAAVILFFKKGKDLIKTWEVFSDEKGNWSFSGEEYFSSGGYLLSARTKDFRGAISNSSPEYQIRVILLGLAVGPWIITYPVLTLILVVLVVLAIAFIIYFVFYKTRKEKKKLIKETREAEESLESVFGELKKDLERRIEYLDSKPGLSEEEKKMRDEIFNLLASSEKEVKKEIEDIEKELGI